MTRRLTYMMLIGLLLLMIKVPIPIFSATEPIVDLGKVTLNTPQEAVDLFKSMLEQQTPSAYKVVITIPPSKSIQLHQAMLLASEASYNSKLYFRPDSVYSPSGEQSLFYVGKADLVMANEEAFNQFLLENKGQALADTTLKLLSYDQNNNYPYSTPLELNGVYEVIDMRLYDTSALRTIDQMNNTTDPAATTYTVESEEALRTLLIESINQFRENLVIIAPQGISGQSILNLLSTLDFQEPSAAFDFYKGAYVNSTNQVHTLQLFYRFSPTECQRLLDQCLKIASDVVAKLITPDLDDYTKAQRLHDYILANTTYDDFAYQFKLDDQKVYSFVGPLIDHVAVCEGYASAYRLLLNTAGIENYTVTGSGDTASNVKKNHAWNIVKLNNAYYHVDTTWDDMDKASLQYYYFALSDSQMEKDHTWNRALYPACLDDQLDYFVLNRLYIGTSSELAVLVEKQLGNRKPILFKTDTMNSTHLNQELTKLLKKLCPDGYDYTSLTFKNVYEFKVSFKGSLLMPSDNPDIAALGLKDIFFNGKSYFAVGEKGAFVSSKNGDNWQLHKPLTTQTLNSITYGKDVYIVAGTGGTLLRSTDAVQWKNITAGTTQSFKKVTFANNRFWSIGTTGLLAHSTDGTRWTVVKMPTRVDLYDLIYAQNKYVIVGQSGTILTSSDGFKWTKQTTGTTKALKSVAYGNGFFLTGGNANSLLKSTDGVKWQSFSYSTHIAFNKLIYSAGNFLAVGDTSRTLLNSKTLTLRSFGSRKSLNGLFANGSTYFVAGANGQLYKSEPGLLQVLHQVKIIPVD